MTRCSVTLSCYLFLEFPSLSLSPFFSFFRRLFLPFFSIYIHHAPTLSYNSRFSHSVYALSVFFSRLQSNVSSLHWLQLHDVNTFLNTFLYCANLSIYIYINKYVRDYISRTRRNYFLEQETLILSEC